MVKVASPEVEAREVEAREVEAVAAIAAGGDLDPQVARHANRLAAILVRLVHDPLADPEAFLDAVETSMSSSANALTVPEADALAQAGISLNGSTDDPRGVKALLGGVHRQLKDAQAALTTAQAATHLDVGASRIRQLIGEGSLLTLRNGDSRVLPSWQFTDDGYVPGIATFSQAAAAMHPYVLSQFMTRPNIDLEVEGEAVSPVEWLTSGGDVTRVATLVEDLEF